jgi:transcriptional regulator with XRE-family HTH domain
MARAALNWSLEEAAEAAGVSRRTVLRFERDLRDIKPELIQAIRSAFEEAGIRFIDEAGRIGLTAPAGPPRA